MTHPHAEILQAIIDGKEFQWRANTIGWLDFNPQLEPTKRAIAEALISGHNYSDCEFRIKPSTVTINGVELEDDRITNAQTYRKSEFFVECLGSILYASEEQVLSVNDTFFDRAIQRGIAHHTQEGAIAFCKARLGIKD